MAVSGKGQQFQGLLWARQRRRRGVGVLVKQAPNEAGYAVAADWLFTPGDSVINGVVSQAATATSTSAPAGVQGHAGVVAGAATATSSSAPAGLQTYAAEVAAAETATAASAPAGLQAYVGTAAAAETATSLATVAGTQGTDGAVDSATSATAVQSVAGTVVAESAPVGGGSRVPRRRPAQRGRGFGFTYDAPQPSEEELLQQAALARSIMNQRFITLHLLTH